MAAQALMVADSHRQRLTEKDLVYAIPVIRKAASMGFNGFGGNCFAAAVALNRVLFAGKLAYFLAVNDALYAAGRTIGHVTLFVKDAKGTRRHIDADGRIKADIDVESWGRLDVEDSDYERIAAELGVKWNEDTAESVALFEATETMIMQAATLQLISELELTLRRALEELGCELASSEDTEFVP